MNDYISQASNFTPWYVYIFVSNFTRNLLYRFSNNF